MHFSLKMRRSWTSSGGSHRGFPRQGVKSRLRIRNIDEEGEGFFSASDSKDFAEDERKKKEADELRRSKSQPPPPKVGADAAKKIALGQIKYCLERFFG